MIIDPAEVNKMTTKEKNVVPLFMSDKALTRAIKIKSFLFERGIDLDHSPKERRFEVLKRAIKKCRACSFREECSAPVSPQGPIDSRIVFQGRNPGRVEDREKIPFSPRAKGGSLLEKYFETLGLRRDQVYITNTVFCYTENNRSPETEGILKCLAWKNIEFEIVQPKFIFLLGNDAIRSYMGLDYPSVLRIIGDVYKTDLFGRETYLIPLYHPAHVVRNMNLLESLLNVLKHIREELF